MFPHQPSNTEDDRAFDPGVLSRMLVSDGSTGELVEERKGPRMMIFLRHCESEAPVMMWVRPNLPNADRDRRYIIGASWAPNQSAAIVVDARRGEQAALLRGQFTPARFAEQLSFLARFYNYAFVVPAYADGFIAALLGTRYAVESIYKHGQTSMVGPGAGIPGGQVGFEVNDATRPRLVFALANAIQAGKISFRSQAVRDECLAARRQDGTITVDGGSCTCVWAAALAAIGLDIAPPPPPYATKMKGFDVLGKRRRRPDDD